MHAYIHTRIHLAVLRCGIHRDAVSKHRPFHGSNTGVCSSNT